LGFAILLKMFQVNGRFPHRLEDVPVAAVEAIACQIVNGMTFDLTTPHGRVMATMLAGIAEFERELIQERIRSGIAAAKARGTERLARSRSPPGRHG
jgi:Resolvase, N terminal domain